MFIRVRFFLWRRVIHFCSASLHQATQCFANRRWAAVCRILPKLGSNRFGGRSSCWPLWRKKDYDNERVSLDSRTSGLSFCYKLATVMVTYGAIWNFFWRPSDLRLLFEVGPFRKSHARIWHLVRFNRVRIHVLSSNWRNNILTYWKTNRFHLGIHFLRRISFAASFCQQTT